LRSADENRLERALTMACASNKAWSTRPPD
jgi:hypothetical protein